jgi:hypothetical protein
MAGEGEHTSMALQAARRFAAEAFEVDSIDGWADFADARRWTDGLPVYPPTETAVGAILDYLGCDPAQELGVVAPAGGVATVEKVAINCVMAGCRPEYAPVVLAALDALLDPHFNLQGVQTTTHSCEPLTIVSGPVVEQLDLWTGECVLGGGGRRANASIGRAIRLILWNIGGGYPGEPTRKILGHPGRYSYLLPEDWRASPWSPLHADRGLPAEGTSAVTVFACEAPHNVVATLGTDLSPELILNSVADQMRALGSNNVYTQGEMLVVLPPFIASHLESHGWSKERVRHALYEQAQRPLSEVRPRSTQRPTTDAEWWWDWLPEWVDQSREDSMVPVVDHAQDLHIAVSGARGGRFLAVCPGWGHYGGFAVTRPIAAAAGGVKAE